MPSLAPSSIQTKDQALADLKRQFLKPSAPLAFSGINKIYKYYQGLLKVKDIQTFLRGQYSYTRHQEVHKVRRRNPTFCYAARQLIETDLIQLAPEVAAANDHHPFILVAIDVFTRKAWGRLIPSKSAQHVADAFKSILSDMMSSHSNPEAPKKILADRGLEFRNRIFKALLQEYNIELFHNYSSYHASHIERFNRTIQKKIMMLATAQGSYRFREQLPALLQSYNESHHSAIDLSPNEAELKSNAYAVRLEQAKKYSKFWKMKKPKFRLYQICRIAFDKRTFARSYNPTTSPTLYKITGINHNLPEVMYTLVRVGDDDPVLGKFYAAELVPVSAEDDFFPIEKIVATYPKRKMAKVRWQGYDSSFDSLVPLDQIKSYAELLKQSTEGSISSSSSTAAAATEQQ